MIPDIPIGKLIDAIGAHVVFIIHHRKKRESNTGQIPLNESNEEGGLVIEEQCRYLSELKEQGGIRKGRGHSNTRLYLGYET